MTGLLHISAMETKPDLRSLESLAAETALGGADMARLLADENRAEKFCLSADDLTLDFTRQAMTGDVLDALIAYAEAADITGKRDAMLDGAHINTSEDRAVLHARLRDPHATMAQENVERMAAAAEDMLATGIEDVVSIGIGGSALGPEMVLAALAPFHQGPEVHVASNVDPAELGDLLAGLNPVTTGFVVISKTFTTRETMANWAMARRWMEAAGVPIEGRAVAVTNGVDAALRQGFDDASILTMDEAIGGRFSLWSAVGMGIMLAFGREVFIDMLSGAEAMDRHFAETPVATNMPVIGGLMRFWNTGLNGCPGLAVIPYESRLRRLPAWLQQLEMESNGKSLDIGGHPVRMGTAPIIFGEPGSSAEHSFFQMLHQGPMTIPVDLLAARSPLSVVTGLDEAVAEQHKALVAQMMAQADAFALGRPDEGFPGGRPVTVMTWDQASPFALGRVLAYYEHVTAVSGWLCGLNSFDQPGVELGKKLARAYIDWIEDTTTATEMPPTTAALLQLFRQR